MTYREAIDYTKRNGAEMLLSKAKKGYICPICGNGSGRDGTGITENPKVPGSYTCFKCGQSGDIIDFIGARDNLSNADATRKVFDELHLTVDSSKPATGTRSPETKPIKEKTEQELTDYSEFYKEAQQNLATMPEAQAYITARGISLETAERLGLGYMPAWRSPAAVRKGKTTYPSQRIIIPIDTYRYEARAMDPNTPSQYKYMNEGGKGILFAHYLSSEPLIFVTEGNFDAISCIECGYPAIATLGTQGVEKFIETLRAMQKPPKLLVQLDNDKAGDKAQEKLIAGLKELNVSYRLINICGEEKDPNDHLTANREAFIKALEYAVNPSNISGYIMTQMSQEIEQLRANGVIKTGFSNIDQKLGGIYPALYVIAAVSSLGKTTLIHQIADQLAEQGRHVLYFSLEMSQLELATKSIARKSAQRLQDPEQGANSLAIRLGHKLNDPNVLAAIREYMQAVENRMNVIQGTFNTDIHYITEYTERYIRRHKVQPVLIIDYLQILQSRHEDRKSAADDNIKGLKLLSAKHNIPVIAISSVNRASYLTPISFEAIKESGNVEFTADVVLGLQLAAVNDELFEKANTTDVSKRKRLDKAKNATPREIQLTVLKNRYGATGQQESKGLYFKYYPKNDLFTECDYNDLQSIKGEKIY